MQQLNSQSMRRATEQLLARARRTQSINWPRWSATTRLTFINRLFAAEESVVAADIYYLLHKLPFSGEISRSDAIFIAGGYSFDIYDAILYF